MILSFVMISLYAVPQKQLSDHVCFLHQDRHPGKKETKPKRTVSRVGSDMLKNLCTIQLIEFFLKNGLK